MSKSYYYTALLPLNVNERLTNYCLGVIVINFVYKRKLDSKIKSKIEVVDVQNDSINNVQDSMAMEKAMNNQ